MIVSREFPLTFLPGVDQAGWITPGETARPWWTPKAFEVSALGLPPDRLPE